MTHVLDILLNNRLYCPQYNNLNDPFEGLFHRLRPFKLSEGYREGMEQKTIEDLYIASTRKNVCSLSSDLQDVKLWSHYANGHTGIAIELEIPDDDVVEVKYSPELVFQGGGLQMLVLDAKSILSLKTNHWEYESEYRIITDKEYFNINGMITNIYCGFNISDLHKDIISKLVSTHGIELYETDLDTINIKIIQANKIK